MEKLNNFAADSIWTLNEQNRTLQQWCDVYGISIVTVRQRLFNGSSLRSSLLKKDQYERTLKAPTLEELKAKYSKPKAVVFDEVEDVPKITFSDAAKERERFAFRLMYGKDNINQLTTY